jgi:hypothetical protein
VNYLMIFIYPVTQHIWFYSINMLLKLRFINIVSSKKDYLPKIIPNFTFHVNKGREFEIYFLKCPGEIYQSVLNAYILIYYILCAYIFAVHIVHILRCLKIV